MNPKLILCLALVLNLLLTSCSSTSKVYPPTDSYFKGTGFDVPREFKNGSATLPNVYAWTASLLGSTKPLETTHADIDNDGHDELFISQPKNAGTGGNGYFIFKETPKGYRFLGNIWFAGYHVLSSDQMGRPRILTCSHAGGSYYVAVYALELDGLHEIMSRKNLPGGDSAHADGTDWLLSLLFHSEMVTEETLQLVFGDPATIEFTGSIKAGKRFEQPFGTRFTFALEPVENGWAICVYEKGRTEDLTRLTLPLHGPNPTEILGWYFRNESNIAPNDGSLNVPMYEHEFIFSPEVGETINGRSANDVTEDDIDRIEGSGRGELKVTHLKLTPPRVNETASILKMDFRCKLTWRTKPLEKIPARVSSAR